MYNFNELENGINEVAKDFTLDPTGASKVNEYADDLYSNRATKFNSNIEPALYMLVIQKFRERFAEDDTEEKVQICCEVGYEYQDYIFIDGSYVPDDTRIGYEKRKEDSGNAELILDVGIFYSSRAREHNAYCKDCGTEETLDEAGNCPNCGTYLGSK